MAIFILPAGMMVLLLLVGPMMLMLRYSFNRYDPLLLMQEAFEWSNYVNVVADEYYRNILVTTLWVALLSTLITSILAFGPAYFLARMESSWKSKLTILTLFPLLVGGVVRSAGYIALLGNDGAINAALMGLGITENPIEILYTPTAVVTGIVGVVLPYMVLTLASVIESIPRQTEEAASNLGAKPSPVFFRVLLPLALPGIIAGATLVFILCMNAFAMPVLLGGASFQMMGPAIYDQFTRVSNWPFGAALSIILLIVTVVMTTLGSALLGKKYGAR